MACIALALGAVAAGQGTPTHMEPAAAVEERLPVVFEGLVSTPEGAPAEGALVVTSAGGKALVDARGSYRIEVEVPLGAERVQVTAVGRGVQSLVASRTVAVSALSGRVPVDPLTLSQGGGSCQPSWLPTFGSHPGTNGSVYTLAVYDDGNGPALFAGGLFAEAGGLPVSNIGKWDGASWTPLGSGTNNAVNALAVYDDGNGPALYAGGMFATAGGLTVNRIARWDGASWTDVGGGMGGLPFVHSLTVFDDGNGAALYAGGEFTFAGGVPAKRVARWDGSSWTPLGNGLNGRVDALAVYDDGGGPALYAGGLFSTGIAKWDGTSWAGLGSGMGGTFPYVRALTAHDDGSGPALYAGGSFTTAGGMAANGIARWDGSSWTDLGSGMSGTSPYVDALTVYDDGAGPALYAGGSFTTAGATTANSIARWDGVSWVGLESGMGSGPNTPDVQALVVHDDGTGPVLYAGGNFESAGGRGADSIARWDGSEWANLGGGLFFGSSLVSVQALATYDDGSGPALVVGGRFGYAGDITANWIALWDGSSWAPLGSGMNGEVDALAVYDDGGGTSLYAGGGFTTAGGVTASRIARWDGSSWTALGSGLDGGVVALTVYDDGGGAALYAGGSFTTAGGMAASRIARWDGSSWSALGGGVGDGNVIALAVYDDGGGAGLYAGGGFTSAGGVPANHVAKWDGSSWSPLEDGTDDVVFALSVYDDGGGQALYAGGWFATAGGIAASTIARWDGSSWSALGGGMNGFYPPRWGVYAMAVHDDGGGAALCAGGNFASANDSGDSYVAKWGLGPDTTPPRIAAPPHVFARDTGTPGEVVTFSVTASDCRDPAPSVVCTPPSGSFFPRGTTLVTCTATDASGNEASCLFPVVVQIKPVLPASPPR